MTSKQIGVGVAVVLAVAAAGYFFFFDAIASQFKTQNVDAIPQNVTLSGTYTCLPHLDTTGPQTEECAFGIRTDEGDYYAVNFGQSASAMEQFQSGAHVRAEGFVVIKEALSSDHWQKYNMKGIFTVTQILESSQPTSGAKLNIHVVCEEALAFMTFPDAAAAEAFVAECEAGEHPDIIERYKADHGYNGATI